MEEENQLEIYEPLVPKCNVNCGPFLCCVEIKMGKKLLTVDNVRDGGIETGRREHHRPPEKDDKRERDRISYHITRSAAR